MSTVGKMDLINEIENKFAKDFASHAAANRVVNGVFESIMQHLIDGDEVCVTGFGTFKVVDKAAGEARNPQTGEKIAVPAHKSPKFKAGASFKKAVNK
jgi:DNA-binding protein HU-beta